MRAALDINILAYAEGGGDKIDSSQIPHEHKNEQFLDRMLMDKERIKRMAKNPDFIPGIYNYCDRWCERCAFTSRCMNFAMEQELVSGQQDQDIRNAEFWESMSEILEATAELLQDLAREKGIDLNEVMEYADQEEEHARQMAKNHICTTLARKYFKMADAGLENAEVFQEDTPVKIPGTKSVSPLPEIREAREIISWYSPLIQVKIMRALEGKAEAEETGPGGRDRDADGSAKVALIGIDRSLAAWRVLHERAQQGVEDIREVMLLLERLRRKVETVFEPVAKLID